MMDELERVRQFDRTYKQIEDYQFLMCRVVKYILLAIAGLIMLLPLDEDMHLFVVESFLLQGLASYFHMKPYMTVNENGKFISVYQKLKYLPISNEAIFKVRKVYLMSFCIRLMVANVILQQIGALLEQRWTVVNLLYPIGVSLFVLLSRLYEIKPKKRER